MKKNVTALVDARLMPQEVSTPVLLGAQSVTAQSFSATSASSSNLSFNINSPSYQTLLDRNMKIELDLLLKADITPDKVVDGFPVAVFGKNLTLANMPFNQLIQNANVTVNDAVLSETIADNVNELLSLTTSKMNVASSTTPSTLDKYLSCNVNAANSNFNSYETAVAGFIPNGSYPFVNFIKPWDRYCSSRG